MNEFDNQNHNETPEEAVIRLRAKIAAGESYLKPELAKVLLLSAQSSAVNRQFEDAIFRVDEAIEILEKSVGHDQDEFRIFLIPCFLLRATITLFHRGAEAGLVALNEAIHYFVEKTDRNSHETQNGLAMALANKAKILIHPLGAYSAAIAAQEQAVNIWRRLVQIDGSEYRMQLIPALLTSGDLKIQSGDAVKALPDFQEAFEIVQAGIADGINELYPILIQALLKLTKLYEQLGNFPQAFESLRESIQIVRDLVADGETHAKIMLTTLYLQHGMLFEQRGNIATALEEFERCRDVYYEILRQNEMPIAGNFALRIGLANVLMHRGNILTAMKRFEEAATSFEDSIQQYQYATEFRPEDNEDETFIPYSIGVVHLNQASMLIAQGKLEEALAIEEKALHSFHQRLEAGYDEILPNLISAYRRMISILQMLGKQNRAFILINGLLDIVESVVDDGKLEFQEELASVYRLRCDLWEERDDFLEAEKDAIQAMRLLRSIADEETDAMNVHVAKIRWSELLEYIAVLRTRQHRLGESITLFQNAIDDVVGLFNDGNKLAIFDVLLAYSQFANFVEIILRSSNFSEEAMSDGHLPDSIIQRLKRLSNIDSDNPPENVTQHEPEDFRHWIELAMEACAKGIELIRRQQGDSEKQNINQFFYVKTAFFHKTRATFFMLMNEPDQACEEWSFAVEQWELLLLHLNKLKAQSKYWAAEAGESDWNLSEKELEEPERDRYAYYADELRRVLQRWANTCITLKRVTEAEHLFVREMNLARDLIRQEIPDADRCLVHSLINYAKVSGDISETMKPLLLFDEARQLIRKRFRNGEMILDDYFMFQRVHVSYALFLFKHDKTDQAVELLNEYVKDIETSRQFPLPEIWLELCQVLDVHAYWQTDPLQLKTVYTLQRKLLTQHPEFNSNEQLREWDEQLAKKIE
jgi:tetratricopeptide (TPR) repeat protein